MGPGTARDLFTAFCYGGSLCLGACDRLVGVDDFSLDPPEVAKLHGWEKPGNLVSKKLFSYSPIWYWWVALHK